MLPKKLLSESCCNCNAGTLCVSFCIELVPRARGSMEPGCCIFISLEAKLLDEPCCYCGPAPPPGPGCMYIWLGLKSLNEPYCIR